MFLVGDAAHRHAPWGGCGGDIGIADTHNVASKLAADNTVSATRGARYQLAHNNRRALASRPPRTLMTGRIQSVSRCPSDCSHLTAR
ncbi:FAD-dependent monooxygenase [Nocardia gamkensis]|uniref:FAD-dependent monooxygenase n=1 Tax=Nocardia gamkensis TaxID=352869 RepID=UPI0037C90007